MDTDEILAELCALVPLVKRSSVAGSPSSEMVRLFEKLDTELRTGAEIPDAWCDDDPDGLEDEDEDEDEDEGDDDEEGDEEEEEEPAL